MPPDDNDPPLNPPAKDRVLRRAFCLSAVACRSFIDEAGNATNIQLQKDMKSWLEDVNATSELEPWEVDCINAPLGSLDAQTRSNGSWTSEGLAVLAWALGTHDLPPHDECVDPVELSDTFDFLQPEARELFDTAELKSSEAVQAGADRSFAVHWRLRQFELTREPMNFAEFAKTAWFGPLNIEGVELIENDLAIDGQPIAKASEESRLRAASCAMERHRAFNWLLGYEETYSEVDSST